jgi:hypothetical protein
MMSRRWVIAVLGAATVLGLVRHASADVGYSTNRTVDAKAKLLYVGGGLGYSPIMKFQTPRSASYTGLGGGGELGFELPASQHFGYRISAEGGHFSLINQSNSSRTSETGSKMYYGGRFGLMFGPITLSAGARGTTAEVRQVSASGSTVNVKYSGVSAIIHGNYGIRAGDYSGFSLGSYLERGLAGDAKFLEAGIQLQFHLILSIQ